MGDMGRALGGMGRIITHRVYTLRILHRYFTLAGG